MISSRDTEKIAKAVKELLLNTGASRAFITWQNNLVFRDEDIDEEALENSLATIPEVFNHTLNFSEELKHLILHYEKNSLFLLKRAFLTVGLFYGHKPNNPKEIARISEPFLAQISENFAIFENRKEEGFICGQDLIISEKQCRFQAWHDFLPHLITLLAQVMEREQAERVLEKVLSRKGYTEGVLLKYIGHVSREIILDIPHLKKRNQLLSELHELLIFSGVEVNQENIVQFSRDN